MVSKDTEDILTLGILVGGFLYAKNQGWLKQLGELLKSKSNPTPTPEPGPDPGDGDDDGGGGTPTPEPTPTPTPTPTPAPGPSTGIAGSDEFGIRKIYPDGGQNLTTFKHMRGTRNYSSGKPSTPTDEYFIEPIPTSFLDCESTAYFLVDSTSNDEISIKMRGGHHGDQDPAEGSCYIFCLGFDGVQKLKKEKPHPKDHECADAPGKFSAGSIKNRWIGFKGITFNEGAGVRCQQWVDTGGLDQAGKPANQWKIGIDYLDVGKCFEAPYVKPNGYAFFFRIDDTKSTQIKFGSLRQIKAGPAITSYARSYYQRMANARPIMYPGISLSY